MIPMRCRLFMPVAVAAAALACMATYCDRGNGFETFRFANRSDNSVEVMYFFADGKLDPDHIVNHIDGYEHSSMNGRIVKANSYIEDKAITQDVFNSMLAAHDTLYVFVSVPNRDVCLYVLTANDLYAWDHLQYPPSPGMKDLYMIPPYETQTSDAPSIHDLMTGEDISPQE